MNDAANENQSPSIPVAYASKHGATGEISERITEKLEAAGYTAETRQIEALVPSSNTRNRRDGGSPRVMPARDGAVRVPSSIACARPRCPRTGRIW